MLGRLLPYLRTLELRLYANDVYPSAALTEADVIEPSFDSYEPQTLKTWHTVYATDGLRAITEESTHTFTVGPGGGTAELYGYWFADTNGRMVACERFEDAPVPMSAPGDSISFLVRFLAGALQ